MSRIPDLLYKTRDGNHSSSKLWFTLTNSVMLYLYFIIGQRVSLSTEPNLEGFAILTLVIAAIVTGNKIANDIIKLKLGAGGEKDVDGISNKSVGKTANNSTNNSTE